MHRNWLHKYWFNLTLTVLYQGRLHGTSWFHLNYKYVCLRVKTKLRTDITKHLKEIDLGKKYLYHASECTIYYSQLLYEITEKKIHDRMNF